MKPQFVEPIAAARGKKGAVGAYLVETTVVKSVTGEPIGRTMDDAERTIRQLRVDARAMQEDAEVAVAELARATRSLRDAILDLARHGAEMRVELGDRTFSGRAMHVGEDVVRIARNDRPHVDVAISAISGLHARSSPAMLGAVSTGYPATLVARCRELLQTSAEVELGRRSSAPVLGQLKAATSTHVEVAAPDGGIWLVPIGEVAWVERVIR